MSDSFGVHLLFVKVKKSDLLSTFSGNVVNVPACLALLLVAQESWKASSYRYCSQDYLYSLSKDFVTH